MDKERLQHGAAVIRGTLGGARAHASLAAIINTWHGDDLEAYSDESVIAIADLDSELERAATDRERLALTINSANEWRARADKLQERNDNQATTIRAFDAELKRLRPLDAELTECRVQLSYWHGEARNATESLHKANAERQGLELQRNDAIDRADKAESRLSRLMIALGALTLSQLPHAALAAAYCDIKAGR